MNNRIPMNLAAGADTRFYIAREVIPWDEGYPKYECALDVQNYLAWKFSKAELITIIRKMRDNWDTVTHIVEVRAVHSGSEEYERLWTIHELPSQGEEDAIGPYEDSGTW